MIAAYSPFDGGLRVTVKARPGTNRPRPMRLVDTGEGRQALEISVAAAPEDGKANKALAEALAQSFGVKIRDITLKSGASSRLKIFEIAGEPAQLTKQIENLE